MPFVKLDTGILDSTLWIDRDLREIFITALLMAEPREFTSPTAQLELGTIEPTEFTAPPGWYGFVPAASIGIINRAGVQAEAGMQALRRLGDPEGESRSKDFGGRRMLRVDGGFLILNYMKYRDKDHTAAERQRRLRARKKDNGPGHVMTGNACSVTRDVAHVTRDIPVTSHIAESREQKADAEGERPPTPQPSPISEADDFNQDPEANIPEGLAILQYAGFVLQQVSIPAGYALKVKMGDAIEMLARDEGCTLAVATKRMLERVRAAGPQKWNFWLQDGGWKADQGQDAVEAAFLGGKSDD
jgi:hypothetical protein